MLANLFLSAATNCPLRDSATAMRRRWSQGCRHRIGEGVARAVVAGLPSRTREGDCGIPPSHCEGGGRRVAAIALARVLRGRWSQGYRPRTREGDCGIPPSLPPPHSQGRLWDSALTLRGRWSQGCRPGIREGGCGVPPWHGDGGGKRAAALASLAHSRR